MAKRYTNNANARELYTQKADDVEMVYCQTLEKNLGILKSSRKSQSSKGDTKKSGKKKNT